MTRLQRFNVLAPLKIGDFVVYFKSKSSFLAACSAAVFLVSTVTFAQVASADEPLPDPPGVLNATTTMEFDANSGEFLVAVPTTPELVRVDGEIAIYDDANVMGPYSYAQDSVGNRFSFESGQWVPMENFGGMWYSTVKALDGNLDCRIVYGTHTYETVTVEVSVDGSYTFRFVESTAGGLTDSYLAVYEGAFNTSDIDQGVIGCNDDREDGGTTLNGQLLLDVFPEFSATLVAGTSYTLVLTTFQRSVNDDFSDTAQGTFELWGPENSLEIPGFSVDSEVSPGASGSVNRLNNDGEWTLTATANAGNLFSSWTCVGYSIPDATANPLVFTPTADTTCTAVFVASEGAPVVQTPSLSQVNYFVTQGFAKGKSTLKNGMKAFINEQLDRTTGYKKFVCTGTVRGKKWTEKRTALANARAAVACDYIEDRFPRAVFELKKRLIKKQNQDAQTVRIRVFS